MRRPGYINGIGDYWFGLGGNSKGGLAPPPTPAPPAPTTNKPQVPLHIQNDIPSFMHYIACHDGQKRPHGECLKRAEAEYNRRIALR